MPEVPDTQPTKTTTVVANSANAVEQHRKHVDDLRNQMRTILERYGHVCDEGLRVVDGVAIMVFFLPSDNYVYIGFGPTGSRQAYRGPEDGLDLEKAAAAVSEYIRSQRKGQETAIPTTPAQKQAGNPEAQ